MKAALPALIRSAAIMAALGVSASHAQEAQPTFEVASVKPAPPPSGGGILTTFSGGPGTGDPENIVAKNISLAELIRMAYEVKPYQIVGPDWLRSTRFDIAVKVAPGTPKARVPAMWRALLAERFQLAAHQESKDLPVYTLVIAKNGPKLKESVKDETTGGGSGGNPQRPASISSGGGGGSVQIGAAAPGGGQRSGSVPGLHKMSGGGITASRLADMLAAHVDRPVVDATGLTGTYDFVLTYSDDPRPSGDPSGTAADPPPGASLFAALQQQLGLKLEPGKGPVPMVVIDSVAKVPTGN